MKTIATILLLCVSVLIAETYEIGNRSDLNRIDVQTTGKPSLMADSTFTNAVLWQTFSYDDTLNYYDLSVEGNDGVATNANTNPSYSTANGGVYDFDGVDDYIDCNSANSTLAALSIGTITAWVYPEAEDGRIVSVTENNQVGSDHFCDTWISGGMIVAAGYKAGATWQWALVTDASISSNQWNHVAVVHDGTAPVIYVDGVAVAQTFNGTADKTKWWSDIPTLEETSIGVQRAQTTTDDFFNGTIDDARIYDRALTSNEVFTIHANTTGDH